MNLQIYVVIQVSYFACHLYKQTRFRQPVLFMLKHVSTTILNIQYNDIFFSCITDDACLNLFSYSYSASKNRCRQLCVNIWFEKKAVPLHGLNGSAVQLGECVWLHLVWVKSETECSEIKHFAFVCFSPPNRGKRTEKIVSSSAFG